MGGRDGVLKMSRQGLGTVSHIARLGPTRLQHILSAGLGKKMTRPLEGMQRC